MTIDIQGLPLVELAFDADGDVDPDGAAALRAALDEHAPTDLLVFSHGWNNTPSIADRLYRAFYGELAPLLAQHGAPDRKVLLLGVFWPSARWTDEPIPDFEPGAAVDLGDGGPAAGLGDAPEFPPPPPPDPDLRALVRDAFPATQGPAVKELLDLLVERPADETAIGRARDLVAALAAATGTGGDGEQDDAPTSLAQSDPKAEAFERFAAALEELGVVTGNQGGAAGFGDRFARLWHGAQEVARQLTYWQMKRRAGTVGSRGLGPFLGELVRERPELRISLIGHSFGARVVSYALTGLPDGAAVESVTLLQGAFSHFAFAGALPFDQGRCGDLFGAQARVRGPIVACHSRFDSAVGVLYPLASLLAHQDAAAFEDETYRWGGMGHDGHQPDAPAVALRDAGEPYGFGHSLVNVDAARVVKNGKPPSGAHSDIVHAELAWVVLCAAGLVAQR
ncbi:serine-threonine protein kinase [Nocardia sp. NPDC003482]